jgi:hypothetical protein
MGRDVIGVQYTKGGEAPRQTGKFTDTGFGVMSERALNRRCQIFRPNHAVMSGMDQGLRLRERYATLATSVTKRIWLTSRVIHRPPLSSTVTHPLAVIRFPRPQTCYSLHQKIWIFHLSMERYAVPSNLDPIAAVTGLLLLA